MKAFFLRLNSLFLITILFLLLCEISFADEIVLNLKTKIYHKMNGQHSLYCSDCVVTEKKKAEELFGAKACRTCFPKIKSSKKKKKKLKAHKKKKSKKRKYKSKKHQKHIIKK